MLENNEDNINYFGEHAIRNGLDPSYLGNLKKKYNFNPYDLYNLNVQDNTDLETIMNRLLKEFNLSKSNIYIPILIDSGIFRRLLKVYLYHANITI